MHLCVWLLLINSMQSKSWRIKAWWRNVFFFLMICGFSFFAHYQLPVTVRLTHLTRARWMLRVRLLCAYIKIVKAYLPQSNSTLMTLPWTQACTLQHRHRPAHSRCTGSFLLCPSHTQSWKETHRITSLKPQQKEALFDNISNTDQTCGRKAVVSLSIYWLWPQIQLPVLLGQRLAGKCLHMTYFLSIRSTGSVDKLTLN